MHAAEREAPDVGGRVEIRHERLQAVALGVRRGRHGRHEQVQQRTQVAAFDALLQRCLAGARVRVDDRKLDLLLVGVEVDEELVDLVDDLGDARVGAVDLVDHEDHRQPRLERLAQHEARLWQRALRRVDEQHDAVDHRQAALDLAAEVRVPGGVDEVELDLRLARRRVAHGGVLGEDRDAALALLVHRVHHAIGERLVGREDPGLAQHGVDERRLAMVDVGDDRHVADVRTDGFRTAPLVLADLQDGCGRRHERVLTESGHGASG